MADYANDQDFLKAPREQQHAYLTSVDPDYAKAAPQEQQAYLASLTGQPAPDTRSTARRAFDTGAQWLTRKVGQGLDVLATPAVASLRMGQGVNPGEAMREAIGTIGAGGAAQQAADKAASVLVPQTPLQAGIMAGTAAAGPVSRAIPALAPLTKYPALTRILGGTLGGTAGGYVEDPTLAGAGRGAAWGAGTTAAGEAAGKLLSLGARVGPGGKGAIAAQDAATYGREMGRGSPPLAGATTVQDLKALAQKTGRPALSAAKEQAIQEAEGLLPQNTALNIPSLGQTVQQNVPVLGTGGYHTATTPRPFTLREANDALSEIGARAFSKNPLDRTFNGVDQRQLYGQVAQEIASELERLNPKAAAIFRAAQDAYKKGLAYLRPLQAQNAYRLAGSNMQFNTPAIQRMLQNPKNAASMTNKMGADYDALLNAMTRGAGQGQDVLAQGTGGAGSAIMSWLRGTNTGFWGLPSAVLRSAVPNLGSQYAGRATLNIPPLLQQILDLAVQRGTQEAAR